MKKELVIVKNTSYKRYEELLLRRDAARKEARAQLMKYTAKFGRKIQQVFEKQIECIKKKKTIGFYQTAINHGEPIDQKELEKFLERELREYNRELENMIEENKNAENLSPIAEAEVLKIKKIYKRIAKQIHPDINPKVEFIPELMELWHRVQIAYNCNDLKDIEEAEVLIAKVIEQEKLGEIEVEIPNIDERIAKLEEEIEKITTTDPYTYYKILRNPEAVQAKMDELEEELKKYSDYEKELDAVIEGFIKEGVTIKWQMKL